MTAFLFIPATVEGKRTRRVDLANYASLFAEVEELAVPCDRRALVARVLTLLLIVVVAIGDTVLVARPYALTHTLPQTTGATAPDARAVTSL